MIISLEAQDFQQLEHYLYTIRVITKDVSDSY